jgi:murein DD-endopeptidase MepM/ murein hydrolase activator NlpD
MAGRMRLRLLIVVVALPLVLWGALPLLSSGAPKKSPGQLQKSIDSKRKKLEQKRGRERSLRGDVASYSRRINTLQGDISTLQRRQVRIQADLDAKRAELERIQDRLRSERVRLARLKVRLALARRTLATRLVEIYKADTPDIVTVVLDSEGFADLLERTEFMQRVSAQDRRIIKTVREAKAEATRTEARLDRLKKRQQKITQTVLKRRNEVASVKEQLVDRRESYREARSSKTRVLASVKDDRQDLEGDLAALEKEQARVAAALRRAANPGSSGGGPPVAGPVRQGSGALIWPVNGPVVSPFGQRWGRLHAGVDIAVPAGTPIRAADSGKVVLMGFVGGYGNYTCVQHNSSLSTCYAHQSRFGTSNGASVSKGQVIGSVGCTGHCFGDHLHFETRVNGSPVDPMGYL